MDSNGKEAKIKPIICNSKPKKEEAVGGGVMGTEEEDSESESLLAPRNGGMSKGTPKTTRKVQWNDSHGNKLAEVMEFQPSDVSDSDDEDSDSCFCTIM